FAQLADLLARDVGDQREVIVCLALGLAGGAPRAHGTVIARLGVAVGCPRIELREKPLLRGAVVGREVAQRERTTLLAAENDVDLCGLGALQPSQVLRVVAELEHRSGLHVSRELRVFRLVRMVAEVADPLYPAQEVSVTAPRRTVGILVE